MDEDNPFGKSQTVDPEVRAYVYSLVNAVCDLGTIRRDGLTMSSSAAVVRTMTVDMSLVTMPSPVSAI